MEKRDLIPIVISFYLVTITLLIISVGKVF